MCGPTKTAFSFYQACGISLSVGLLLHGLVLCGHGGVIEMAQQQGHDWRSVLENKVKLSMIHLAVFTVFSLGEEICLTYVRSFAHRMLPNFRNCQR